jgi:hypothetical protein
MPDTILLNILSPIRPIKPSKNLRFPQGTLLIRIRMAINCPLMQILMGPSNLQRK